MIQDWLKKIETHEAAVQQFFNQYESRYLPPLYLSCDLRHSGRKLAIVDTNAFPGGFNNLCKSYSQQTITAFKKYFEKYFPNKRNVILFIEEHTRNRYYLENVATLKNLLSLANLQITLAYEGKQISEPELTLFLNDQSLTLYRLQNKQGELWAGASKADLVIANNDFSAGIPEALQKTSIPILPHPNMGWWQRTKTGHFKILTELIGEFAQVINADPWFLNAEFTEYHNSNLQDEANIINLAKQVDILISSLTQSYQAHQMDQQPYIFIKNNSGTYGMGILTAYSGEDILQLNRRERNKLLSSKGSQGVQSFILQEGIPTIDTYSDFPIEPVIYQVGYENVGGFFRINSEKDNLSNLNSKGMYFSCLCLHKLEEPHEEHFLRCHEKRCLVKMSLILTKLATIATAIEGSRLIGN